eukprot:13638729-Alexandrium_andersonii.AAC.1
MGDAARTCSRRRGLGCIALSHGRPRPCPLPHRDAVGLLGPLRRLRQADSDRRRAAPARSCCKAPQ